LSLTPDSRLANRNLVMLMSQRVVACQGHGKRRGLSQVFQDEREGVAGLGNRL